MTNTDVMIHPTAIVKSDDIGNGTRIWEFANVMKGAKIGKGCNIGGGCFIEEGVEIGDNVVVKNNVSIWKGVTIGNGAFVGPGVIFTNEKEPRSLCPKELAKTIIQEGASLGAGCVLVAPITIGKYATVGAGSVATRDVEDHELVFGNPAVLKGYVCYCGRKLLQTESVGKEGTCSCGKKYRVDDGVEFIR